MPVPPVETISDALRPLTERPDEAAVLCDIDGTLSPIVERAEEAVVPEATSRLLGRIARRYRVVACISGRGAAEARRIVGVGGIAYAGAHGAELLLPGEGQAELVPAFATWKDRVQEFALGKDSPELRMMRVRIEDKGAIVAFHWRGAREEQAALAAVQGIAAEAESAGLLTHWGRKVLEIRPPVPIDKGQAVRELLRRAPVRTAVFGGDDATDLDVFDVLSELLDEGALDTVVCIGVRSDEGPAAIVERADLVVEGTQGFAQVLEVLAGAPAG
ncbi:MAG: trehalose 6-phosphate phosphatase [Thermoleophilaceae bacterium]|jgi:trehalose 6-phosphate phosphatase|nr:trehalose 6-phosphate phosphatase [Thermoleophilaceae bacterium]